MLAAFQDYTEAMPKNMPRVIRKLYCNFSEESFSERLGSVKGHLHLREMINIVTASHTKFPETQREVLNSVSKSSRRDVVGVLQWQPWSKSWSLPVGDKRKLYGTVNRIGGRSSAGGAWTLHPKTSRFRARVFPPSPSIAV